MKILSLPNLKHLDFSATNVFSMFQQWAEGAVFNTLTSPKTNHSLLYFAGCDGHSTFPNGDTLTAQQGDVVYIPAGACYKTLFCNKKEQITTILINFQLSTQGSPFALAESVTVLGRNAGQTLHELFFQSANAASSQLSTITLMSGLYQILDILEKSNSYELPGSSGFQKIAKGIAYLENDSQQLMSIDQLAEMCHVSSNTFRRMFRAYSGVSPLEFRLTRKISRAKQLLQAELFTVSEISDMLHFSDVSYFSRIFKKKCGLSPQEYLDACRFGKL